MPPVTAPVPVVGVSLVVPPVLAGSVTLTPPDPEKLLEPPVESPQPSTQVDARVHKMEEERDSDIEPR
jgi:hypothetical protein